MPSGELNAAELFKEDLYGLLEIDATSEEKDIRKAYRKKALKCHPDKNPDNPEAADLFRKLSAVFEVLVNQETRKEYDKILRAKKAAAERTYVLDAKRRKLKEDLERRERQAAEQKTHVEEVKIVENLEKLLKNLRENGSKLLHEEQELLKKDLEAQLQREEETVAKLRLKWNKDAHPQYDDNSLTSLLSKYGDINVLVVSKKKGTAIVEFADNRSAVLAFENEKGFLSNQLSFEWVGKPVQQSSASQKQKAPKDEFFMGGASHDQSASTGSGLSSTDFSLEEKEEEVFAALRRAAERQKLIQQIQTEEALK